MLQYDCIDTNDNVEASFRFSLTILQIAIQSHKNVTIPDGQAAQLI